MIFLKGEKRNTINSIIIGEPTNPPESAYGLWYDARINRFVDEGGHILHNLSHLFPLWVLDEWKRLKSYGLLYDRDGNLWELFYCDPDEEEVAEIKLYKDDYCKHDCLTCGSKCEIYDLMREW